MKGLKKLALASAVLALSTGAFAMEALQDDDMSNATGQAGLTITTNNTSISASQIRYYDADGTTGASTAYSLFSTIYLTTDGSSTAAPIGDAGSGACGVVATSLKGCADLFSTGGSININNFSLTEGASTTSIDVGSTGTGAGAVSGLLIGASANSLTVTLGGISVDNGNELDVGRTNQPTYSAGGFLATGKDLGGIALSSINLSQSVMLITPGAVGLDALSGSTMYNSGLTITQLSPILSLTLTAYYYNTGIQSYSAGAFTANTATFATATNGVDGVVTLPIAMSLILTGPIEIGVGLAPTGGYAANSVTKGLQVFTTGTSIGSIDIGGAGGILIAGSDIGSIGVIGLKIGSQLMSISGH